MNVKFFVRGKEWIPPEQPPEELVGCRCIIWGYPWGVATHSMCRYLKDGICRFWQACTYSMCFYFKNGAYYYSSTHMQEQID